ncbi:MAG: universal stress protein [Chitinophagaceae bacterium]|nr:universal stress protein [Chitinophagaceae bacterium]
MKKILVPTDFSANSKSGIRYAINWASRQKFEITFIHVLYILRPTQWSDAFFEKYAEQEETICRKKFETFIAGIYRNMNIKPGKHSYKIIQGISADITILDYCRKNKDIDYICISTRGAGKFKKIFGTNTGNLITKSNVPVLAVPNNYKTSDITRILYAADFRNYPAELKKVIDFAMPLKASIEVLHLTWPDEITLDKTSIEAAFKKQYKYGLKIHFKKNDASNSLIQNLQNQIRVRKPSVVIMFTNQERTFFQKLFNSSKAESLSFNLKVPLLVFSKK